MGGRNESSDFGRRFKAELTLEHAAIPIELPDRFAPVPLGEMRSNQDPVGALPERFAAHCGQTGFDRFTVSTRRTQLHAEDLERVHAKLAVSLSFDEHPLVVVIGQKLLRRPDRHEVAVLHTTAVEQPPGTFRDVIQIDMDDGRQPEVVGVSFDESLAGLAEPPQGRAKVADSVLLGRFGPQTASDMETEQGTPTDREERQQSFAGLRDRNCPAIRRELEPPKEAQLDLASDRQTRCRLILPHGCPNEKNTRRVTKASRERHRFANVPGHALVTRE
jgi:hypothetical protein